VVKRLFGKIFGRSAADENTIVSAHDEMLLEVVDVIVDNIVPNPFQPRKSFSDEGLAELSASIREFGIIQPLIIRKSDKGYELIAGERRLRASVIAGLTKVPCIIREASNKEMAEIALIENLQREDLHYFEEAFGYESLLSQFSLTQEVLAIRVGKSQSTIANKLRLLRLSPHVREQVFSAGLSERHARALLKLNQESEQLRIINMIADNAMTVKDSEALIRQIEIAKPGKTELPKRPPMLRIVKDVRIFINTVHELVAQIKKTGLPVRVTQEQDADTVTITMVVPKRR
jgi:ParB family chromosome partitioning protein